MPSYIVTVLPSLRAWVSDDRESGVIRLAHIMNRTVVAVAWLAGVTVPLLLAVAFLFGCCVLPFHRVIHELMPGCQVAADLLRGDHHEHGDSGQPATPRQKQEPVKRLVPETTATFVLNDAISAQRHATPTPATAHRDFIAHGAIRCDRDVGLHLLVETFLV